MPLEGQHLGHYRLLVLIGSGGMGEVYLAEDARIGQQVAIKVIRAEGIAYPGSESAKEATRLFEREAKAIARLDHPNILPLYAYGEETLHDTQLTYLVMPYRKEGTLAMWLRLRGNAVPLSPREVDPLLQQAAEALQHAHNQHILHQDIKPSNFLIRLREDHPDRPDLLLTDFGIAKLTSATASSSQSIRGTPTYMAPEQWDGHPVTASDQYALAIMVYELLVGHPPFVGNPGQVMRQHYMTLPPVPSSLNGSLSPAIDSVLVRALAKDPEERFASVTAFARAFQETVHSDGALQATLAISQVEAESGAMRSLTLPGGRQVSVTMPAGVGDGATLRLEGQGMPYYEGGPSGPLVLTIAISAEMSPQPLSQESTDPTVDMSRPNAELRAVEEPSVSPARSEAPGELEPTVPASSVSETASTVLAINGTSLPTEAATPTSEPASTVLATDATSLPTEAATPTPHTPLPVQLARSTTPPAVRPESIVAAKPAKPTNPSISRRLVLVGLVGLVIVALASGILWFTTHQASPTAGSVTVFPVPTVSNFPTRIAAGPDGNLWFTEKGSQKNEGKIGRISPSGTITEFSVSTAGSVPWGITAGPDGNIWFTESYGNQIGRISPSGNITEFSVSTANSAPLEIAAGPDGNLWFTEYGGNQIGRISPSGKITEYHLLTANSGPSGITAGPDGNLWFTEQIFKVHGNNVPTETIGSKIGRITPTGSITEFTLSTANSQPDGITAGPDGNLWFTEYNGDKIGRITTSGSITEFPTGTVIQTPEGITAGPDGNLWFTDLTGDNIGRITSGK